MVYVSPVIRSLKVGGCWQWFQQLMSVWAGASVIASAFPSNGRMTAAGRRLQPQWKADIFLKTPSRLPLTFHGQNCHVAIPN